MLRELANAFVEPCKTDQIDNFEENDPFHTSIYDSLESCGASFSNLNDDIATACIAPMPEGNKRIYSKELLAREDHGPPNFEWITLPMVFEGSMLREEEMFTVAIPSRFDKEHVHTKRHVVVCPTN